MWKLEALVTSKRFPLGEGPSRGLHRILCNTISHRCRSCLRLPPPPPPTCSCSSLLATQFSQGQPKSKNIFTFLLFSFVCFIAHKFVEKVTYLPVIWKNLLLRPTSPGDPVPVLTMQPWLPVTGPRLHLAWAEAEAVTRPIVWCWLCKLESPAYHHTLSHAGGQGDKSCTLTHQNMTLMKNFPGVQVL